MTYVGFALLFGLGCVLFSCQGQVYSPLNKTQIVVPLGVNATLNWTFVGDPSKATRTWYFTRRRVGSNEEEIAFKRKNSKADIPKTSLPGVAVEDPAILLLKNVDERYNGKYRLNVLLAGGGGESSVEFYIAVKPIISVNCSSSTTVVEGDYFACKCKGTDGNPPADVTWYKNNTPIVTGKEEAIFRSANIDKDDSGTYRCEAESGIEEAKNKTSMELIVNLIPKITINCSNVASANQSDNFVCKCEGKDGYPVANVTWYNNSRLIVTGKESATLSLSNVSKDNSGMYRCEAKSSERAKNETSIELIVNYPPENVTLMLTRSGPSANITCIAEGQPEPSFEIFLNETILFKTNIYIIPDVNRSHVGNYTCVAKNILDKKSSDPKFLRIEVKPKITTSCLDRITVNEGDNFTCECKGKGGNPPADVTWYKGKTKIVTGKVKETATLSLNSTLKSDTGTYRCEAISRENVDDKTEIYLFVTSTPVISINCTNGTVWSEGDDIFCKCNGTGGNPPANVTWYKDNQPINTGEKGEEATLVRINVNKTHSGTYKCEAKSQETVTKEIFFLIKGISDGDDDDGGDSGAISGAVTAGIIIGVLFLVIIIVGVVCYFKTKQRNGYKGNANVNPDDGGVVVNHYELGEGNAYDSIKGDNAGDNNAYDSVNPSGSSTSTGKPPQDTMPPVYAAVDKNNREGKTLYATLDSVALESDGSKKPKDDRPPPTEYADINFLKKEPDQNAGEAV